MSDRPTSAWLRPLSQLIHDLLGWDIPENHWDNLERNFLPAAEGFGYSDPAECVRWLTTTKLSADDLQNLAAAVTIGETYFFRERNHFEPMTRHIFQELIQRKRKQGQKRLRIWSAACSSGEEPYSLAILLHSMLPDIDDWSIRILATDITPAFLERARRAEYRQWSFRGTPEWVKSRYFDVSGETYRLKPVIKERVDFKFLNLAEEVYPSRSTQTEGLDLIFCRNVLIYFSAEQARKVIGRMARGLVKDGWLVLSPTETMYVDDPTLHRTVANDAILYRKGEQKREVKRAFPLPPLKKKVAVRSVPVIRPAVLASASPVPPKVVVPKRDVASIYAEADRLFEAGNHRETIQLITSECAEQATDGYAAFCLARAHANLGDLSEAFLQVQRAISIEKLRVDYHYLLAMILQEQQELDEAERVLKRVVYLDDAHAMALFSLGHLAKQKQRGVAAEKYFQHAARVVNCLDDSDLLPQGEGITAGQFKGMILGHKLC